MTDPETLEDAPLDAALRRHYGARRLSAGRVEAILAAGVEARAARRRWPAWMTAAAAALVVSAGGLHVHQQLGLAEARRAVLAEVAMNHDKDLAAEVLAGSYAQLGQALDRLEFDLQPRSPIPGAEPQGARYCSIQGRLAAQLKLRSATGRLTLYVTPVTESLARLAPHADMHDGVDIRLWTEDGRFFALAADAAP